jgi:hypothetical protein
MTFEIGPLLLFAVLWLIAAYLVGRYLNYKIGLFAIEVENERIKAEKEEREEEDY